jgi:uncharacterized membrane protein YfhO
VNKIVNAKSDMNQKWLYALAFIVPFVIFMLAMLALHVTPFGDETILFSDANGQYIAFVSWFRKVLKGEQNLFYSFENGIGGNTMGLFAYYLCSPFNIVYAFFATQDLPTVYTFVSAAMIAMSGLTFYICLSALFGGRKAGLIFSSCYALMAYNVTYCWHQMWLNAVIIFPIIILGLVRLYRENKRFMYILALTYAVITNYYIGYMICIAVVLIFFTLYSLDNKEHRKGQIARIISASMISGGMSSVIWLPAIYAIKDGRLQQRELYYFSFERNFALGNFPLKFISGSTSIFQIIGGLPNVFCGFLIVFLALLFLCNKTIDRRKRTASAVLLGAYIASFYLRPLSVIFQGFSETNWFPYRYSFIFSFLIIIIAYQEFMHLEEEKWSHIRKLAAAFAFVYTVILIISYDYISTIAVVLDAVIIVLFLLGFHLHRTAPEKATFRTLTALIALCCAFDLYFNVYLSVNNEISGGWENTLTTFQNDEFEIEPVTQGIEDYDDGFYRIEKTWKRINNDSFLYGYDGIGHSSSTWATSTQDFLQQMGMTRKEHYVSYGPGIDTAVDDLLGIKYVLTKDQDLSDRKGYRLSGTIDDVSIYVNSDALNIGFLASENLSDISLDEEDIFQTQNSIWKAITGNDQDIYTHIRNLSFKSHNATESVTINRNSEEKGNGDDLDSTEPGSESSNVNQNAVAVNGTSAASGVTETEAYTGYYIEITFTAEQNGPVYLYYYDPNIPLSRGSWSNLQKYVGNYNKGDAVSYRLNFKGPITETNMDEISRDIYVVYENTELLHSYANLVKSREMMLNKLSDTHLMGTFQADQDMTMLFTFPYDDGWTLKIDGAEVKTERAAGALLSAKVDKGKHNFELTYCPPGIREGAIICFTAMILTAFIGAAARKNRRHSIEKN